MNRKFWIASLILALAVPSVACCEQEPCRGPGPAGTRNPPDFEEMRDLVLQRCELSLKISRNKLPWYFYYESGVELLNEGEPERALESLQMTANLKPDPERTTRMYGMWFVDYLPYYQLSLAYSELENWPLAWKALQVSERLEEFSPEDEDFHDFAALKALLEGKLSTES